MNNSDLWELFKNFCLFCSSYSILFIITIILKSSYNNLTFGHWILIGAITSFIIIGYTLLALTIKNPPTGDSKITIESVENKNDLIHTYLLPYIVFILSFMAPTPLNINQTIAILIFLIMLFIIYCKSDLSLFDICLIAIVYSYFKVTSKNKEILVITKENLYNLKGKEIKIKPVMDNTVIYGD